MNKQELNIIFSLTLETAFNSHYTVIILTILLNYFMLHIQ